MRPDYWALLLAKFFFSFLLLRAPLYPVFMRGSLGGVIYMLTSLALLGSLTEFPTYRKFKLQSGHAYLTLWSLKKSKRGKVAEEAKMYRQTLHSLLEVGNRKITTISIPRMCPLVLLERQQRALEIKMVKQREVAVVACREGRIWKFGIYFVCEDCLIWNLGNVGGGAGGGGQGGWRVHLGRNFEVNVTRRK